MSRVLPILFNTDMVRAILAGRKTITRRIVKHNVDAILNSPYHKEHSEVPDKALIEKLCRPPYQTGDILYVRETWGYGYDKEYIYKADDKLADLPLFKNSTKMIYRPSIHMPKEAARIFLRVTDVRVERLKEITAGGIRNEGLSSMSVHAGDMGIAQAEFKIIWNSTIKKTDLDKYGWDANPWVWVIEFEQCGKPEEEE